jgi:hypothetical protein
MPMNKLSPVGIALFGNCRGCLIHSALAQLSASRPRTRSSRRGHGVGDAILHAFDLLELDGDLCACRTRCLAGEGRAHPPGSCHRDPRCRIA